MAPAGSKVNNVLFVAGMHRSGTSLMAQWLHHNGLFIGDQLLSGFSDNKHGHFEDIDFLKLSIDQLEKWGLHESGLILKDRQDFSLSPEIRNDLLAIIERRSEQHTHWGWKEPRGTLYLPSLKALIPTLKVVAMHRHPGLVIESLYKRLRKNKWYYTRNPFKRLKWHIDIDLNPQKWIRIFEQAYCQYNKNVIEFRERYPDDVFTLDASDILTRESELQEWLQEHFGMRMKLGFRTVFDDSIYTRQSTLKADRIPDAVDVYHKVANG